jgi:hypothetical protein
MALEVGGLAGQCTQVQEDFIEPLFGIAGTCLAGLDEDALPRRIHLPSQAEDTHTLTPPHFVPCGFLLGLGAFAGRLAGMAVAGQFIGALRFLLRPAGPHLRRRALCPRLGPTASKSRPRRARNPRRRGSGAACGGPKLAVREARHNCSKARG